MIKQPNHYKRIKPTFPCDDCRYSNNISKCITCKHYSKRKIDRRGLTTH